MSETWIETTVGAVMTLQRGFDVTRSEQHPGSVPVVSSGGIASHNDVAMAAGPGVVMGRKGTLGRVFYLPGPYWPHDTTLWVKDFKGNDPRFTYYFLSVLDVSAFDVGSANPTLNRNHVHPLRIRWPEKVRTQRAIAEVLGALDEKIAANAQLIRAADTLASSVFESLPALELRPLTQLARFVNGKAFTKGASGIGRVVIRIAELNSGLGGSTVYSDIDVPEHYLARPGDLLFAWSGSLTVHRWYRPDAIINQHIFKVIPEPRYPTWLVHQLLLRKLEDFRMIAADKATTMGHIQRRHLDELVPVPSPDGIQSYDDLMTGLWRTSLSAEQESVSLGALRDTLLPELMSGRLRVRDAEKPVEAVV